MTTEIETTIKTEIPAAELPTAAPATADELSQVKQATQALVDALQGLAEAKLQSATDLTEEAHHSIDRAVQTLRSKTDQSLQVATHQLEDIDARLIKAAKAAWAELTAPSSDS
jgi:hypothetical protein